MNLPLFDVGTPPATPPAERESPTVRRTRRRAAALAAGWHPLTGGRLHLEAAPAEDRTAPGRRCGNCRWLQVRIWHDRTYAKCGHPGTYTAEQYEQIGPPRATHGEASDLRSWWPACGDHEPGDPKLPDAMRWVPDPAAMR